MRENDHIRKAARVAGVHLYQVANAVGVSEITFHRWLRFPLDADKENKILSAIDKLAMEVI